MTVSVCWPSSSGSGASAFAGISAPSRASAEVNRAKPMTVSGPDTSCATARCTVTTLEAFIGGSLRPCRFTAAANVPATPVRMTAVSKYVDVRGLRFTVCSVVVMIPWRGYPANVPNGRGPRFYSVFPCSLGYRHLQLNITQATLRHESLYVSDLDRNECGHVHVSRLRNEQHVLEAKAEVPLRDTHLRLDGKDLTRLQRCRGVRNVMY